MSKETTAISQSESSGRGLFSQAQIFLQNNQFQQAINCYRDILAQDENHSDALHYLGVALHQNGENELAMEYLMRSVVLKPDDAMFQNNIGVVLEESNDIIEAKNYFKRAVQIDPENIEVRFNLARVLVTSDEGAEAINELNRLAADQPEDIEIKLLLATARIGNNQDQEAIDIYENILEKMPANTKILQLLAETHASMGQYKVADEIFDKLCREEPENLELLFQRARIAELNNALDTAEKIIQVLLDHEHKLESKTKHSVYRLKAVLSRRNKACVEAINWLKKVQIDKLSDGEKVHYFTERGNVEDKLGLFEEAFGSYTQENEARLRASNIEFSSQESLQYHARLRNIFKKENLQSWESVTPGSLNQNKSQPLFILGFPRSGTTLTEQILGAHPGICFGGEFPYMSQVEREAARILNSTAPFPECLASLSLTRNKNVLLDLQQLYMEKINQSGIVDQNTRWFTDKSPLNSEKLAMISLMFSNSPIIHVVRHPLDTCLSTFFTNFKLHHWYSLSLENTAHFFKRIFEMIEFYKQNVPGLKYCSVKYEDLIEDPEPQVRRMLEFIGEPYDARCLEFHKSKRVARTASYAQVNQKLYTSSMYRYKNYRKQVEPILPILMPVIESLGYTVED